MQVQVKQSFRLNIDGKMYQYYPGLQDMPEDHFNHRYSKFFIEEVQEEVEDKSTSKKRVKK